MFFFSLVLFFQFAAFVSKLLHIDEKRLDLTTFEFSLLLSASFVRQVSAGVQDFVYPCLGAFVVDRIVHVRCYNVSATRQISTCVTFSYLFVIICLSVMHLCLYVDHFREILSL